MQTNTTTGTVATGLAIFTMFFGAGNVVFPLILGQLAGDLNNFAMLGLLITAVGVPFLGLTAMTLFDGNYKHFFERIGSVPGFVVTCLILALIGPFGAAPRCITLSFATLKFYLGDISLIPFNLTACLLIFALTYRKNKILDLLGYVLTPILLVSLGIIIVAGWINGPAAPPSAFTPLAIFSVGLIEGYQTMDLLGAFFFSSIVLACLRQEVNPTDKRNYRRLITLTLKAGCIGMGLLALSYFGFSSVASFYSGQLPDTPPEQIPGALAVLILGPYAAIVACVAVALACLTTAIALCSVAAEFLHIDIMKDRIGYVTCLIIVLILTFFVSTFDFSGIRKFLGPILEISYPALILLSLLNILHKLYDIRVVKTPVLILFLVSLVHYVAK